MECIFGDQEQPNKHMELGECMRKVIIIQVHITDQYCYTCIDVGMALTHSLDGTDTLISPNEWAKNS